MIFYLSCTGNTLFVAEKLRKATGDKLINMAEPSNIQSCWHVNQGESLGFCFPVHGWRPPKLVRQFIKKMIVTLPPDTFCYSVCTAGDTVGEAIDIIKRDLADVGITLHSAYSLLMPNTYVGLPFMDVDPIDVQNNKLNQAKHDLERIIEQIRNKQTGVFSITRGRWPRINSRILGSLFLKFLISDKPFHIDEIRCINCGQCVSSCPVHDIKNSDSAIPQWHHSDDCLTCFACYHHCPKHVIRYGHRTKGKGQYFFAEIKSERQITNK